MRRHLKRRLALIVALAAVLAGGTAVALAATGKPAHSHRSHHRRHRAARLAALPGAAGAGHSLLATAASYLGVSPAELRTKLASGETLGQIAAATPGRSEAGLVAALVAAAKQRLSERAAALTPKVERLVKGVPARRRSAARAQRAGAIAAALSYLGISRQQLAAKRLGGMTLAQIANSTPGKSEAGLRSAVVAALEQRLSESTAGHSLSRKAEQRRQKRIEAKVTQMLHHSRQGSLLRATGVR